MSDETPAGTIRRAVALMKERACAAAPGPWHPVTGIWGDEIATAVIAGDGDPSDPRTWLLATGFGDALQQKATAEHAASMHPCVGIALAEWLDAAAQAWDEGAQWDEALNLACVYLGETR